MSQAEGRAQGSTCPPTIAGRLRLYGMRFCPFTHRVWLVLLHKYLPFEEININLKDKPDWFLAINPLGQVPVLQIDDKVVVDSVAICDWLDEVYPENRLQPADPDRRAWDKVLLENIGKVWGPFCHAAMKSTDPAEVQAKVEEILKSLKFYEDTLAERGEGPFFGGVNPAMFDFLFWPIYERIPVLVPLKQIPAASIDAQRFPKLTAWANAMEEVLAVKATTLDVEKMCIYLKG